MEKCPRCAEEWEKTIIHCNSCDYTFPNANLPTEPIRLDIQAFNDSSLPKTDYLLRRKYPQGYNSCYLDFRVKEFEKLDIRGKRKYLHLHVVLRRGNQEILEVKVPSLEVVWENIHVKKSDRNKMKRFIKDNLVDIMAEIKQKLAERGISLNDWGIDENEW